MTDSRVYLPHLKSWRTYHLLTMGELAEAAGVSRDTIIHLEAGKQQANFATVGKLAAALGVSRRELVYSAPPSEGSTN